MVPLGGGGILASEPFVIVYKHICTQCMQINKSQKEKGNELFGNMPFGNANGWTLCLLLPG